MKSSQIRGVMLAICLAGLLEARAQNCPASATLSAPFDVSTLYTASGYMGDGKAQDVYVRMEPVSGEKLRPGARGSVPYKVTYRQGGSYRWAGVLWQFPPDNWGDKPGQAIRGASKITFWAAGEKGGEIVEFKAGGNFDGKCKDSFVAGTGNVALTMRA